MDTLFESKQMDGQPAIAQAERAILHVLNQIRDNKAASDVFGLGSQSFALLTEAAATMANEPVKVVRERYA